MILKPILLKLSGTLFLQEKKIITSIIMQIKELTTIHALGIVIGGGNFFRGQQHGKMLGIRQPTADAIGMLATNMNGLILRDLLEQIGVPCTVVSPCPIVGLVNPISPSDIYDARKSGSVIIFSGGLGSPFFTTDTTSIVRALQIEAKIVWKATNVDFLYDKDPSIDATAKPIKKITHADFINKKLRIMDLTAITMAEEHSINIKIFNLFTNDSLLMIARDHDIGSTIYSI